jgi:membrane associated rhomboid family serine protease
LRRGRERAPFLFLGQPMYFFYYYPIGVDVPRPRVPWATALITVVLCAVFAMSLPLARWFDFPFYQYAYRPASTDLLRPITAIFLHAGWAHLIGNLVYFLVFAPALEKAIGRGGLLLIFLGTGTIGNLAQGALVLHTAPHLGWMGVVGASGAISGLLGFFLLRFPYAGIRLAYWAFLPLQGVNRTGVVRLPAFVGVLLWVVLQVVLFSVQGTGGGTAYGAHLGGLAMGVILALSLRMPAKARWERLRYAADRHREKGNFHAAVGSLEKYTRGCPHDRLALVDFARALEMEGDSGRALKIYRDESVRRVHAHEIEDACDLYLEGRRANQVFHLPASEQRQIAFWLEKSGRAVDAATAYLDYARFHRRADGVEHAMARAATLLATRREERGRALEVLRDTLRAYPDSSLRPLLEDEMLRLQSCPS